MPKISPRKVKIHELRGRRSTSPAPEGRFLRVSAGTPSPSAAHGADSPLFCLLFIIAGQAAVHKPGEMIAHAALASLIAERTRQRAVLHNSAGPRNAAFLCRKHLMTGGRAHNHEHFPRAVDLAGRNRRDGIHDLHRHRSPLLPVRSIPPSPLSDIPRRNRWAGYPWIACLPPHFPAADPAPGKTPWKDSRCHGGKSL